MRSIVKKWAGSLVFAVVLVANVFARGSMSIDFTVAGYSGAEVLANFPVLVRLSTEIKGFRYSDCAPDGADLVFLLDNEVLPREIERWNPEGESLVWVRLPELRNGMTFELSYNDRAVTEQPSSQTDGSVWQPAGYVGVWHLGEATAKDSSGFGHDGLPVIKDSLNKPMEGQIGLGQYFDGRTKVDCGAGVDLAVQQGFSVEGWVKSEETSGDRASFEVAESFTTKFCEGAFRLTTPGILDHSFSGSIQNGVWSHTVYSFIPGKEGDGAKAYKDGRFLSQTTASQMNAVTTASRLHLGANKWGQYFKGVLDEIRLSKVIPSADWVLATYETMALPSFLETSDAIVQASTAVLVECDPMVPVAGMIPPAGVKEGVEAGAPLECSMPSGEIQVSDSVRAYCQGWKIYSYDKETGEFVFDGSRENAMGTTNVFSYRHPDPAVYSKVEWQLVLSNRVTAAVSDEVLGRVDKTIAWIEQGDTVTITAIAKEGGAFKKWIGDVQGLDPESPTITVTADRPKGLTAVFVAGWHVDPNGDDETHSGLTPADAFRTLAFAVGKAQPGDRVILSEGTHLLTDTITVDKELTITGAGMDKTVIDRASNEMKTRFFILNHPKAVLENVTLRNAQHIGKYDERGNAVLIDKNGGTLRDSRVTACRSGNYYRRGTIAVCGVEGLVSHCVINNNTNFGSSTGHGGGIYLEKGLVENCLIYGNHALYGGGVQVEGQGMVRDCTISGNHAGGTGGGVYWNANPKVSAAFQNNLVAGNTAPMSPGPGGDEWFVPNEEVRERLGQVAANCFFGPYARPVGANSLAGDPAFTDPGANDFTLLTGSPAMDVAASYEGLPTTDLTGNARVIGGAPDIGCHEFVGTDLSCGFQVSPAVSFEGETVSFQAIVRNASADQVFSYDWTLRSAEGETVSLVGESPSAAIAKAGWYDVTLTVSDGSGATATLSRPAPFHVAARTNYLALAGSSAPVYPWKTAETGSTNLLELVSEAVDGSVFILPAGEFKLPAEVVVMRGVKLLGAGMDKTVFTRADTRRAMRLFQLGHADALLDGVTLRNGSLGSPYGQLGNGILIGSRGGTLSASRVTECHEGSLYHRGAVGIQSPDGLVTRCIVDHNSCKSGSGAGIYISQGVAENCLVYENVAKVGGGVHVGPGARVRNCTIAGNTSTERGGGLFWEGGNVPPLSFVNNIVAGNTALNDAGQGSPEWAVGSDWHMERFVPTTQRCLFGFAGASVGTNSFLGDPAFSDVPAGDFTLMPGSAAIDRGIAYEGIAEIDLAGGERVQNVAPDIGCHEFSADKLSCGFTASPTVLFEGEELTLVPTVFGAPDLSTISFKWILSSSHWKRCEFAGEAPVEPIPEAGWYDVTLEVTDTANGLHASLTRPGLVHVAAKKAYLAPEGSSTPAYPWKTPETASTNLHELVAEAVDGVTIEMAAGVYKLTNQVEVLSAVKLLGAGIDKTVFVPVSSSMSVRFFYLNHPGALLDGVTLKGARHGVAYGEYGNALLIGAMGGTFSRSRVTEGRAYSLYHCGMVGVKGARGLVTRCIIDHNVNSNSNAQAHGNGLALSAGVAENCLVYANEAESFTAGLYLAGPATVRNCTFANNRLLTGPAGVYLGWNADKARVVNCVFAGNETSERRATGPGAPEWAADSLTKTNCLVNCLFSDSLPAGPGAVTGDPLFKDPSKGDYRIARLSPAHDAGLFEAWMTNAVDLAGAPRVDHKELVDIGCYEAAFVPRGTMLLLR